MNPRTPVDSVAPLRPPRRSPVKTEPAAPIERLDPGTVLAPTRFLRELPGQAPSPGGVALCDGRRSVAEVARDAGLAPDLVRELLSQLYAEGLVHETGEGPVPAVLFFEHVRSLCLRWRRARLAARPGIEPLFSAGTYSKRLAVGYLLG
jgi:DNA-binding transcriptional ArsR family regulator